MERQIADMKVVSSDTEVLNKFFQNHVQFVKGSNVSSVFFPKKIEIEKVEYHLTLFLLKTIDCKKKYRKVNFS
ncbi:putative conjugative transfer protein TraE [Orientia chuto str. Dubai]|uniref:Putative conjugative transfer protein TraE n=1 Tax=Orientia chuto str. Dubai TaxID=1359168 RepID=A0A0F3MJX0_9RICK|nr:putative conjugative transfer protein TraE [Orientia chuto str. Dubai]